MSKTIRKSAFGFICLLVVCVMTFGVVFSKVERVGAENDKTVFSSEISAVKLHDGEVVDILPEDVKLWNESTRFDSDYLNGLYEFNQTHKTWMLSLADNTLIAEIYRANDAFNPVNPILKWESSLQDVSSYKVRVAYDNKFTQCVLIENDADIDSGVTLENAFAGTKYYWQVIAELVGGDKVYSPIFDFKTADTLRTVTIDGVSNTRDIGGYETAYGYVKQGLVYRSARLESITAAGLTTLKTKFGVKTDLDLRGVPESTTAPNCQNPAGLDNYYTYTTPQYALVGETGFDYSGHYENVRNIMSKFADKNNYPIDFHCAVGRDRTGTIASLLKAVLGYSEIDIINDYFTSMFATTGAWDKRMTNMQQATFMNILTYLRSFDGDTLADKTANYLINKCGMTQDQIDAIRNIMTGAAGYEVDIPAYDTFEDTDNYSDCNFVTFEKYGVKKVVAVVANDATVSEPFDAGEGYVWTVNGAAYDFDAAVSEDITVKALKAETYTVTVNAIGADANGSFKVNAGSPFDFNNLNKDGYDFIVVSAEGRIITSLTPNSDITLNVIYKRK